MVYDLTTMDVTVKTKHGLFKISEKPVSGRLVVECIGIDNSKYHDIGLMIVPIDFACIEIRLLPA